MTTKPLDEHSPESPNRNKLNQGNLLANVVQWRCMNCGQHIFVIKDSDPPDQCEYCNDMTTWQFVNRSEKI